MTESLWLKLKDALDRRAVEDVVVCLLAATEKERKGAFPELVTYIKGGQSGWWWDSREVAVLGLAVLGCAPTAKRALTVLNRGSLRWQRGAIPASRAVEVLLYRAVPWLPELAAGLADRLDTDPNAGDWLFVDAIARAAGIAPPLSEGFTAGWVAWVRAQPDPGTAIADGPYAHYLLPMLFEHERIGRVLEFTYQGKGFNSALARLGRTDPDVRALLLDGCLARLLRGGRPGDLRAFVTLHDELAPTPGEIARRCSDYAGLIAAEPGTIAAMAQRSLRAADEAGAIKVDTILDVGAIALGRREKNIVKTQTTWLRQAAKRHPDRSAELLSLLDKPSGATILPAPVDFGVPIVPDMPPPIAGPAEFAEELAAYIAGDWSVPTTERILDGLVRLPFRDHAAYEAVVQPVVQAHSDVLDGPWAGSVMILLGGALSATLGHPRSLRTRLTEAFLELTGDHSLYKPLKEWNRSPQTLLEIRLQTIQRYADTAPVPFLVATPTLRNGLIDPAVLVDRMAIAERDGWLPWPTDLDQALLRLPREIPPPVVRRAQALVSPAGKAVAQRMRDGHPDPVVLRYTQSRPADKRTYFDWGTPDRRVVVSMDPPGRVSTPEAALFTLQPKPGPVLGPLMHAGAPVWSAALPAHREVVAAWALPALARTADADGGNGAAELLPLLAEAQGPAGPATVLALAYGLSARETADRVAAVDAVIGFASTVDFQAVGAEIGAGVADDRLKMNRPAAALRDAAEAGAVEAVWSACIGLLRGALPIAKPRPGTADVVRLAARCTRALGRTARIDGLAELAERGGSSQLVAAARELREALG
jgi:hypothetical protein